MKFKGLKRGDHVSVETSNGHVEWVVEKVGRKYFSAGSREFRLDSGILKSGRSTPRAYTLEENARALQCSRAEKSLHIINVVIDFGAKDRQSRILAVYEALQPMIEAEMKNKAVVKKSTGL